MYFKTENGIVKSEKKLGGRYSPSIFPLINKIIVVARTHKEVYNKSKLNWIIYHATPSWVVYGAIWCGLTLRVVAIFDVKKEEWALYDGNGEEEAN